MSKSKNAPPASERSHQEELRREESAPLRGSRALLRVAWALLAIWIAALSALALHVVGVW